MQNISGLQNKSNVYNEKIKEEANKNYINAEIINTKLSIKTKK